MHLSITGAMPVGALNCKDLRGIAAASVTLGCKVEQSLEPAVRPAIKSPICRVVNYCTI